MTDAVLLNVEGLHCEGCANAVKKIVARAYPDAETQVDLSAKLVRVSGVSDAAAMAETITKGGYPAKPAS